MGTTATNLIVKMYHCPLQHAGAVLEVFAEHHLAPGFAGAQGKTLLLGVTYGSNIAWGESAGEVSAALQRISSDLVFEAYTTPSLRRLGDLRIYAPDLGEFASPCDADGRPVHSVTDVESILAATATHPGVRDLLTGRLFMQRVEHCAQALLDHKAADGGHGAELVPWTCTDCLEPFVAGSEGRLAHADDDQFDYDHTPVVPAGWDRHAFQGVTGAPDAA